LNFAPTPELKQEKILHGKKKLMTDPKREWFITENDQVLFYPFYYKSSDLLSCNSFLFRFPKCFVVIDPGGKACQLESIILLIEENDRGENFPVYIFITHGHYDHVKSLQLLPRKDKRSYFSGGHAFAVAILKNADKEQTLSFLYPEHIFPVEMDFELFSTPKNNPHLQLSAPHQNSQCITLPGNVTINAFQTPGHSPCSVCYQIGKMLFVGDLFFAHNPAVAGTFGWSQPHLCKSLGFVKPLINSEKIERVFGGHGLELSPEKTIKVIDSILNQLPELVNLVPLDGPRYDFLNECTITFMKEIEHQIISQNGRLLRIAGELEKLGEVDLTASISDTSIQDTIESYLERFHCFINDPNSNMLRSSVPMQGTALMKLLQNMFSSLSVPPQLTLLYLERLQTLFSSHLTLVRGIDFSLFTKQTNLSEIIKDCIVLFTPHFLSEERLFEVAESEKEFAIYLAKRIDGHNRTANISYFTDKEQFCQANREYLKTLMGDVIESLVSGTSRKITIEPFGDENITGCRFFSNPAWKISTHKARFYHLFASLLDGNFRQFNDGSFSFTFRAN
jgi:glyoxylase-like metal-dependent hydrolase (beta-lactamase superfamily II)